jgi:Ca2+-binding EF-hand superfamily protein
MSVSSVNPATTQTYQPAGGGSSSTASTSETSGAAETSGSTAASTSADAPASSTTVTLSPGAQVLASLAVAGITFSEASLSSLGISPDDVAKATTPALQFALLQRAAHAMAPKPGGAVSQSDFEKLAAQFGGTKAQADQLFRDLDTNGDGAISNEAFLNGLAKTSKDGSSPLAQLLLGLMNTDDSGSVSFSEFSKFETAFVQVENGGT